MTEPLPAIPKDLKLVVATVEGAFWIGVKNKIEADNLQDKRQREINNITLEFAEKKIKEEKAKEPKALNNTTSK